MQKEKSLVHQVHDILNNYLNPGDLAIDCTVGNGHDTAFLAQIVAPNGRVLGVDIQEEALKNTDNKLRTEELLQYVDLKQIGHQHIIESTPSAWIGKVAVIVFNLGYLPGGDKSVTTKKDSTLVALQDSLKLLKPNGILSIMLYPGHPEGLEEAQAVELWSNALESSFTVQKRTSEASNGPRWLGIVRVKNS